MTADLAQQIARMAFAFDVSDERRQEVHAMARTARDMIDASNASIRKIAALESDNARLSAELERARPVLEAARDYVKRMGGGSNFYALLSAVKTYDAAPVAEQLRTHTVPVLPIDDALSAEADALIASKSSGVARQLRELTDAMVQDRLEQASAGEFAEAVVAADKEGK